MIETLLKQAGSYFQSENPRGNRAEMPFQNILMKVKQLEDCNKRLAALIDPTIKKYCQVANITHNRIVIIAANGSIATQIRLQSKNLLQQFLKDPLLRDVKEIECKVQRKFDFLSRQKNNTANKMQLLSENEAEIIKRMAEGLQDPKLRAIMLRIASHKKTL